MSEVDWTSVAIFCAGVALGGAVLGLSLCARAWDSGFRAGISHAYHFPGKEPFQ